LKILVGLTPSQRDSQGAVAIKKVRAEHWRELVLQNTTKLLVFALFITPFGPGVTGDFAALGRSALVSEAKGAASIDKFSTQKRRTEQTAMLALGDHRRLAIAVARAAI
jgi:hypothetical protein